MKLGIIGCVMVADGKTFGRFLMIFCVLGGKIGKVVLTLIFDYFLKFGSCGVERLAGLSEEGKLVLCLATQVLQFDDELGGERDDVFLAFFCGYGDGGGAEVNFFFLWVFRQIGNEHWIWDFSTQVVHIKDIAE